MKKIALAASLLLTVTGAAFAENPYVGDTDINTIANQQAIAKQRAVDGITTSSVHDSTDQMQNSGHSENWFDEAVRIRQLHFGNH